MIEFYKVADGTLVGTLDPATMEPSNGTVASVVRAKREMGWSDEQILLWADGWSNGYFAGRKV